MSDDVLEAELLSRDPRIANARALMHQALRDQRSRITGVRPPLDTRRQKYGEILKEFAALRGGALYYPYLGSGAGAGALVELADGSVKYDMITGIGVHPFGHSDPELFDALLDAALTDTVMQGNLQQNQDSVGVCRAFTDLAQAHGAKLSHCFLSTSGAMANENALKILFQAKAPANRLLAFENCFAGRTLALSQVTDRAAYRTGLPETLAVDYLPFFNEKEPVESQQATRDRLLQHLARHPGRYAGMMIELVQGEGGYFAAPREFYVSLARLLRKHQIPIFFDEIQTFGRTTRPFAFQHFQLDSYADVVTVGKMTQVCATLFREDFRPAPGLVSQTFTGATSAIHAAKNILQRLQTGHYFGDSGRVMQVSRRFTSHFEELQAKLPGRISGPWGLGVMLAFSVFDGSTERSKEFLEKLFDAGVVAFLAGAKPARIRMLPPFGVITNQQVDEVCSIIERILTEMS